MSSSYKGVRRILTQQLTGDPFDNAHSFFESKQAQIWTQVPGIIQSYDPTTMTVSVQPAIQGIWYKPDGQGINTANNVNLPLLIYCPVIFPSGGGCTLTFPLAYGDECVVLISSRCIDNWWAAGAVENGKTVPRAQAEYRMHDLSDGMCLPGMKSLPNVLPNVSTTTTQLRTNDGLNFIEIDAVNTKINVVTNTSTGIVNISSPNR